MGSGIRFCSRIQEADLGRGDGADVVVEVTGSVKGLQAALDGTRRGAFYHLKSYMTVSSSSLVNRRKDCDRILVQP